MNSSKRRFGWSRLQWLLLIALMGYEAALYRHFVWQAPLRPERVVELQPEQTPMGFLPEGVFVIAVGHPERVGLDPAQPSGPVEIRAIPTGELLEHYRLQAPERRSDGPDTEKAGMPGSTKIEPWYGVQLRQRATGEIEWIRDEEIGFVGRFSLGMRPKRVDWELSEDGRLLRLSDRAPMKADQGSGLGTPSEVRVRHPPVAMLGDRFAFFPNVYEQISATPELVILARKYLTRLGIFRESRSREDSLALYDLERREFLGLVSTSIHQMFIDPQGRGFIAVRSPLAPSQSWRFEFYGAPPARDWPWMLWRGLGPPAVIAALVLARWAVVRLRQRGFAVKAGSDDFAEVVV